MFDFNVSGASLIFIYSTCFGSLMGRVAQKIANEAPPGCLVSTTTYRGWSTRGSGSIKHYRAGELAWTDVRFYERVGVGPWEERIMPKAPSSAGEDWKGKAREVIALQEK